MSSIANGRRHRRRHDGQRHRAGLRGRRARRRHGRRRRRRGAARRRDDRRQPRPAGQEGQADRRRARRRRWRASRARPTTTRSARRRPRHRGGDREPRAQAQDPAPGRRDRRSPTALLASNTSSISITTLAAVTSRPARFLGMHFFNPVPMMALVELIRGLQTVGRDRRGGQGVRERLGKTPIVVKNSPGFVVNRILCPMINEAVFALQEGLATAEDIDNGMKLGCNHPIGPLALADMIGLDVLLAVMNVFYADFNDPEVPAGAAAEGNGRGGLPRPQDGARLLPLRLTTAAASRGQRHQERRAALRLRGGASSACASAATLACGASRRQISSVRTDRKRPQARARQAGCARRTRRARFSASPRRPCRQPRSRGSRGTSPLRRCCSGVTCARANHSSARWRCGQPGSKASSVRVRRRRAPSRSARGSAGDTSTSSSSKTARDFQARVGDGLRDERGVELAIEHECRQLPADCRCEARRRGRHAGDAAD